MGDELGIYLHIPFCRSKCSYCGFYSLAGQEGRMEEFQQLLLTHIRRTARRTGPLAVDTVYFGGGTPSYYGPERLCRMLEAVGDGFSLTPGAEITLEANPDSVDLEGLRTLRRAGFNRLSLGYQSARPEELRAVRRPHTAGQGDRAAALAREAGFENLSLDLICGLPGQSGETWRETVEHVLSLRPDHLSCYGLGVEEDTPLARQLERGECSLPDGDEEADWLLWTAERLAQAGLVQYEISNFARPGFESRHNLRYGLTRPYLSFGPGAHSDFGGKRFSWVRDLEGYLAAVEQGEEPLDQAEYIPGRERAREYLMLRLRLARGVAREEYEARSGRSFAPLEEELARFAAHGWAQRLGEGRWRLTPRGFLVSTPLIGALLDRSGL